MTQATHGDMLDGMDEPLVVVRRCREPETIERILERDYFDEPVRSFSTGLRRAFASEWCAKRDEIYFVVAEVDGKHAGFVFGHAMGDGLVKFFARRNPRHLPQLLLTWLRMRLSPNEKGPVSEAASVPPDTSGVEAEFAALGIQNIESHFVWSPDARSGRIALLSVHPDYRGYGLARRLLDGVAEHMSAGGVKTIEAHIDPYNISSVRAFLKSGYDIWRMADKDFLARRSVTG